jgi:ABC-type Fe3+-hydroxamate transport system substrate-binding protein
MSIRRRVKRLEQKAPDRSREPPVIVIEFIEPGTMRVTGSQTIQPGTQEPRKPTPEV